MKRRTVESVVPLAAAATLLSGFVIYVSALSSKAPSGSAPTVERVLPPRDDNDPNSWSYLGAFIANGVCKDVVVIPGSTNGGGEEAQEYVAANDAPSKLCPDPNVTIATNVSPNIATGDVLGDGPDAGAAVIDYYPEGSGIPAPGGW